MPAGQWISPAIWSAINSRRCSSPPQLSRHHPSQSGFGLAQWAADANHRATPRTCDTAEKGDLTVGRTRRRNNPLFDTRKIRGGCSDTPSSVRTRHSGTDGGYRLVWHNFTTAGDATKSLSRQQGQRGTAPTGDISLSLRLVRWHP